MNDQRAALTFDDGPSEWTGPIVDLLVAHNATATFFVLGCAIDGREAVLERLVWAGCEIGVHGHSHRPLTDLSDDEIRSEMVETATRIEGLTGRAPRLWRAPYLEADARVRRVCAAAGLTEAGCTVMTDDYIQPVDEVVERAVGGLQTGAIVLLHDGRAPHDSPTDSLPSRAGTVAAVPRILAEAARRGLRLVTLSELMLGRTSV